MVRSSVLVCALVATALLLIAAPRAASGITCGTVDSSLTQCVGYIRQKGPLTPACCAGVAKLNSMATTTADRRTACNCLKSLATSIPGINYGLAAGVPGKCRVNVPYAISPSTDCSRVP